MHVVDYDRRFCDFSRQTVGVDFSVTGTWENERVCVRVYHVCGGGQKAIRGHRLHVNNWSQIEYVLLYDVQVTSRHEHRMFAQRPGESVGCAVIFIMVKLKIHHN